MNNNELTVKCICDNTKGVTKGMIYSVSVVRKLNDKSLSYNIKDDYGHYTDYVSDIFSIVDCYIEI